MTTPNQKLGHRILTSLLTALLSGATLTACVTSSGSRSNSPTPTTASPAANPVSNSDIEQAAEACGTLAAPLTPEEETYARAAWQYFENNRQSTTGFTNSADQYPSGTLWDMGNYLMALNAARWLNLIDQPEFDAQLNQFLSSLSELPLVEGALPNKVYNSATGEMVDYTNQPTDKGLGWSALDIGRVLTAFHVIRTCHPQYNDWLSGIVSSWQIPRSVKDGSLYGAVVNPDGSLMDVQEGRLGYEEYATLGYQLWGFAAPKALDLEPMEMVEVEGVEIPVDQRDFATTNDNNYVVSESYILHGIEFGWDATLAQNAEAVLTAQEQRYEKTGHLTAVSEDNIDQSPHFLYNTVYANGTPWAVITEENEAHPELRTLSTKAAFGWYYLFPEESYTQKLFEAVQDLQSKEGGYYAGIYEENGDINEILTGNTNGLILEILYFKARGNQPLLATTQSTEQ